MPFVATSTSGRPLCTLCGAEPTLDGLGLETIEFWFVTHLEVTHGINPEIGVPA